MSPEIEKPVEQRNDACSLQRCPTPADSPGVGESVRFPDGSTWTVGGYYVVLSENER